ncbi:hypothetical protein QBC45DRAFT_364623 [Copromyces sp. CBS 386.78]|nr:hypothetical protein QBC45DRAFT_364623 [Copromyces sp. CBS 386.78]
MTTGRINQVTIVRLGRPTARERAEEFTKLRRARSAGGRENAERLSHTAYAPQEEAQHKRFCPKASPAGRACRIFSDAARQRQGLCWNGAEVARAVNVDSPADRRKPRDNNTP